MLRREEVGKYPNLHSLVHSRYYIKVVTDTFCFRIGRLCSHLVNYFRRVLPATLLLDTTFLVSIKTICLRLKNQKSDAEGVFGLSSQPYFLLRLSKLILVGIANNFNKGHFLIFARKSRAGRSHAYKYYTTKYSPPQIDQLSRHIVT
jgi:uncharacterized protein YggT (Ycf19 family)